MFVSHVSIKVELLELGEPAETKKAEDFLSEVVAEVAIAPNLIIRIQGVPKKTHFQNCVGYL